MGMWFSGKTPRKSEVLGSFPNTQTQTDRQTTTLDFHMKSFHCQLSANHHVYIDWASDVSVCTAVLNSMRSQIGPRD